MGGERIWRLTSTFWNPLNLVGPSDPSQGQAAEMQFHLSEKRYEQKKCLLNSEKESPTHLSQGYSSVRNSGSESPQLLICVHGFSPEGCNHNTTANVQCDHWLFLFSFVLKACLYLISIICKCCLVKEALLFTHVLFSNNYVYFLLILLVLILLLLKKIFFSSSQVTMKLNSPLPFTSADNNLVRRPHGRYTCLHPNR